MSSFSKPESASDSSPILYPEQGLTHTILECAFEVHNTLGVGFLERVYANALSLELQRKGLRVEREKAYQVRYKEIIIGDYVADLVVEGRVLLELKSTSHPDPLHEAQLMNYLRASGIKVGLLLNFGRPKLYYRRFVC